MLDLLVAKDPLDSRTVLGMVGLNEVVERGLQVVDLTASIMAKENRMPLRVFALQEDESIIKAVSGNFNGTTVTTDR